MYIFQRIPSSWETWIYQARTLFYFIAFVNKLLISSRQLLCSPDNKADRPFSFTFVPFQDTLTTSAAGTTPSTVPARATSLTILTRRGETSVGRWVRPGPRGPPPTTGPTRTTPRPATAATAGTEPTVLQVRAGRTALLGVQMSRGGRTGLFVTQPFSV